MSTSRGMLSPCPQPQPSALTWASSATFQERSGCWGRTLRKLGCTWWQCALWMCWLNTKSCWDWHHRCVAKRGWCWPSEIVVQAFDPWPECQVKAIGGGWQGACCRLGRRGCPDAVEHIYMEVLIVWIWGYGGLQIPGSATGGTCCPRSTV